MMTGKGVFLRYKRKVQVVMKSGYLSDLGDQQE
jgi:hypothetical protein